ncbi:hypothetical protein BDV18DRAFT_160389 [Aspergillus unguis]
MEGNYHYPDYHHYSMDHLPLENDVQFYPHHGVLTLTAPNTIIGVPYTQGDAVKGAHFPQFGPVQYPRAPADLGYWAPPSPFEDSVRSISPQTDCQSNGCLPALSYDDAVSCASGFESSPSPSYPEMPALYKQEAMSSVDPVQPMPQPSPIFLQEYAAHQPNECTAPPTPPTSEAISEASKPRIASSRKGRGMKKGTSRSLKKTAARSNRAKQATATKRLPKKTTDRRFQCCFARYGCPSTFPSKNEWKRHVSSQHIQPGFYRCDVGRCRLNNFKHRSTSPSRSQNLSPSSATSLQSASTPVLVNDFNRKDLFIQHQRRMHAPWNNPVSSSSSTNSPTPPTAKNKSQPATQAEKDAFETSLETVWKRCWRQLRAPPTLSRCGFCSMEFRGASAWKERMEHVARHFEKKDPGPQNEDVPLREWAVKNGVVAWVRGEWRLVSLCAKPVFSLIIINKAGGLIYQREFQPGLRKLSTNDYLVLAGTFHGVHAITRSITPKIPNPLAASTQPAGSVSSPGPGTSSPSVSTPPLPGTTSSNTTNNPAVPPPTPSSTSTYPIPSLPPSGLETLETDKFRLTCFQTLTGTKFLLFTDPLMDNVDVIMRGIYEIYADYVMKNPFYQIEMPVRCERFDRGLGGFLRGRG